ncbi:MAG TPA: enoyl-CoA hydratase-related protein, partial [Holophagaceae bacterium]|nr:enoyl-CoA hydratase-related protein [Holophagaceae bacterium]
LGLDRPAARNALGRELMAEFRETLSELRFDPAVRVVILHSLVPGIFCAGADLKERATMGQAEVAAFVHGLRAAFTELEDLPMPVLAALEGAALGGGLELALACDLRVAGMDAKLGLPETGLAIIPGAGGTQRLPRLIGKSKAKELIFTGRRIDAEEALRLGLADRAVPAGQALEEAKALAREILPNGPVALRMAKLAVNRGVEVDRDSGLAIEQACYAQVIPTKDRLEGLAAFKEKRRPVYRGE